LKLRGENAGLRERAEWSRTRRKSKEIVKLHCAKSGDRARFAATAFMVPVKRPSKQPSNRHPAASRRMAQSFKPSL
jgi:hypothetical protein